ncbi:MAG: hypothetical protein JSU73_06825 [candidate division WOR-3 bacterium]|nr:MAG: hypothetical protein JSU73_06825 [candidate division WOR-3 bacterium]
MKAASVLALALFSALPGCALVVTPEPVQLSNAGFENSLDSGWVRVVTNDSNTAGYVERSDTLGQPGGGFAARVFKYHKQFCSLSQAVPIDTLGQVASFQARFRLGGSVSCSPIAAVVFSYLDSSDRRLGRTVFYLPSQYSTWADSDTQHLILATDSTGWNEYSLNLLNEVNANLPGVDAGEVKRLRVELLASVDYSG